MPVLALGQYTFFMHWGLNNMGNILQTLLNAFLLKKIFILIQMSIKYFSEGSKWEYPDSKVHGANMGPTWLLPAPDGPHVGPMNLAIRGKSSFFKVLGCHQTSDTPLMYLNSSPPSAAYMCQWIGSSLVQIMACRLFGAKPLSKPVLKYCQLYP